MFYCSSQSTIAIEHNRLSFELPKSGGKALKWLINL